MAGVDQPGGIDQIDLCALVHPCFEGLEEVGRTGRPVVLPSKTTVSLLETVSLRMTLLHVLERINY